MAVSSLTTLIVPTSTRALGKRATHPPKTVTSPLNLKIGSRDENVSGKAGTTIAVFLAAFLGAILFIWLLFRMYSILLEKYHRQGTFTDENEESFHINHYFTAFLRLSHNQTSDLSLEEGIPSPTSISSNISTSSLPSYTRSTPQTPPPLYSIPTVSGPEIALTPANQLQEPSPAYISPISSRLELQSSWAAPSPAYKP